MGERLKRIDEIQEEYEEIEHTLTALRGVQAELAGKQARLNILRQFLNRGVTHSHSVGWVASSSKK